MAAVRKLVVEVAEATNLSPKDGQGASSPYVVAHFHGQRKRTRTAVKDLSPRWGEVLEFAIKSSDIFGNALEIDVLHDKAYGPTTRNNFLGRVRLSSSQFVWKGEEALIYYPLRGKSWLSWVQGDIGLKIYYTVEVPPPPPPPPQPAAEEAKLLEADAALPSPVQEAEPKPPESAAQSLAPPDGAAAAGSTTPATPPADGEKPDEEPPNEDAPPPAPPSTENAPPDVETTVEAESPETAEATSEDSQEVPPPTLAPSRTSMGPEMDAASHWVPPPPVPREVMAASVSASVPEVKFAGLNGPHPPMPPMTRTYTMDSLDSVVMERSSFDLVEKMHYLFVRVVKARHLPTNGSPVVKIVVSGTHIKSKPARKSASTAFFEWDQTFAFGRDAPESSSILEVSVWDPPSAHMDSRSSWDVAGHKFFGGICFDASEIPVRDPPDSPLAPQWYRLEGGGAHHGDLMLATWIGTQADESFPDAWKTDAAGDVNARAKVYQSPKLWYLRATVLEAQDVLPLTAAALRETSFQIKAQLGFQMQKTKVSITRDGAPSWNEDLLFVVAEPFSDNLKLTIENRLPRGPVVIGEATVPLMAIERRVDDRKVASRWFTFEDFSREKTVYKGRVHLRLCFDGGYHVMDEAAHVCSDYRPTARQLWKPPIGSVELGIIGCKSLLPMKTVNGKGSTDAYCVAKYGPKWVRTRTVRDTLDPRWNEQYTWRVYDPCTVLTIGVFDSWGSSESDGPQEATPPDFRIGKVRIRISTLQANRVYRNSYPLLLLANAGMKKMGEVEIALRFGRTAPTLDVLHAYSQPLLPLMHHVKPLGMVQQELLRSAAVKIMAAHLSRSEPPLKCEVVLYMLDADSHTFSMRKVRANWLRIINVLAGLIDVVRWIEDTRGWKNPTATALVHALLIMLVWFPELIVPTLAFYVFAIGAWNYRFRARGPALHFDPKMSLADAADPQELDEEFDQVPSARPPDVVRVRYDKLRAIGARVQTMLGDLATQGERAQALVTWRDPRATGVFIMLCFVVAVILYLVPTKMVAMASGFYYFRHPIFRDRMPSPALNFFRRLPSLSDRMM
ncbi:FT-interacting protein 7 [Rhodamnia argentea]|uniref:FT-interacting protein 7 n=1 Tax=Rhodamnia argentea TaxID=178133 RepID=A0A8B8NUN0_9MYRT|nr:FT-interacting protein 7 [Rhodamnia argentea]